ncbi:MFS transporter [Acidimangrovimonas sediminis]|uniref:MFS transporter n=1 Tax=Acidimangrovimonas sediminis TaxID=2056283 RepID=UPI000C809556|nr:MFS transporter [Acidimangrovimonas sediminis]
MTLAVNAGPRLDRLPTTSFHRRLLWLIGAGMFLDSFDIYLAGGVLGALNQQGWSNIHLTAAFLSATFFGMLIGAFAAGFLGDAKGRKFTYQFNLMIFGLASLAGALAPNMWFLIVARFFMGLGLGAEIVIGYSSIGEFIPPKVRGKWSSYLSLITNSALFVSTALGYLIIPTIGWRAMFAIVGVGALVIWYLRKAMPESPRWLESQGRTEDANTLMDEIERECAGGGSLPPVQTPVGSAVSEGSFWSLFRPPLLSRTLVSIWLQVVINFVIYGFIVWIPTFLIAQGLPLRSSLGYTTLMSLGGPAGAFLGVVLADRIGRRNGLVCVAIVAAVLGWLYGHASGMTEATVYGFLLFSCTYLMVALGIATYIPEMFGTAVRMRAAGISGAAGRVAGIIAPQAVVAVYAGGNTAGVLAMVTAMLISMAVVIAVAGTETNHRTLEDIDTGTPDAVPQGRSRPENI